MDTIREAVAVFDDVRDVDQAVGELQSVGFNRTDISLLAPHRKVVERLGRDYADVGEIMDEPDAPGVHPISSDVLFIGQSAVVGVAVYLAIAIGMAIAATFGAGLGIMLAVGAVFGIGGGVLGLLFARRLGRMHATWLGEQLQRGGIVMWVNTPDPAREREAVQVLGRHTRRQVRVHDLPATA